MKTNDDRQHLTQAQLRLAVTLFWGPCQQVLLPVWLKELAKVVNGAKNRYSIHRNLPLLTKVSVISTSYLRVCRFLFHISYVELTLYKDPRRASRARLQHQATGQHASVESGLSLTHTAG